jgi:uncharacterized phage protein gp47/JayE
MAGLPEFLTNQTEEAIRQRMLDSLPSDLDKSEGSFIWDAVSPAAIELALAAIWAQEVLRRGFAGTSFGPYLDLRAEEHGISRKPAVKAHGQVKFTGTSGTVVPAGTRVATLADIVTGTPSIEFATKADVTLDESGTAAVEIEATEAGAFGNVPAGAIRIMATPVPGVTSVANLSATFGGQDIEDDASLLARLLQRVRSPSSSGNKADYIRWASEVPGVGGVSVVPVKYGPGTVSVAIIGLDKRPASPELVAAVQDYIAPPHRLSAEAKNMTIGGAGTSIDGTAVKMTYHASGAGTIRHALHPILPQLGIWRLKVIAKADQTSGADNLLQIGVWNISGAGWTTTTPTGSDPALMMLRAGDMQTDYAEHVLEFYWNGQDQIELRIDRLTSDTTTTVWVDRANFVSAFSRDDGEGLAPIGARVYVEPAVAVIVSVSVSLTYAAGVNPASVRSAVEQAIRDYITSLAFAVNNDVIYTQIGSTILSVQGVVDFSNLLVNGGTSNVVIGEQEVAVPGTITVT